jgi:hypothetical protein
VVSVGKHVGLSYEYGDLSAPGISHAIGVSIPLGIKYKVMDLSLVTQVSLYNLESDRIYDPFAAPHVLVPYQEASSERSFVSFRIINLSTGLRFERTELADWMNLQLAAGLGASVLANVYDSTNKPINIEAQSGTRIWPTVWMKMALALRVTSSTLLHAFGGAIYQFLPDSQLPGVQWKVTDDYGHYGVGFEQYF